MFPNIPTMLICACIMLLSFASRVDASAAPYFISSSSNRTVYATNKVEIKCAFEGEPTPKVRWLLRRNDVVRDLYLGKEGSPFRVQSRETKNGSLHKVASKLTIRMTRCMGPFRVYCVANNTYGHSEDRGFHINSDSVDVVHERSYFIYSKNHVYYNGTGAEDYCTKIGGNLAAIPSEIVQRALRGSINTEKWDKWRHAYIGGKRRDVNGSKVWIWPDGTIFYNETKHGSYNGGSSMVDGKYVGWASGYPKAGIDSNCLIVSNATNFSWEDRTCDKDLRFICELKALGFPQHIEDITGNCSSILKIIWRPYHGTEGVVHRITVRSLNSKDTVETIDYIPTNTSVQTIYINNTKARTAYNVTITVSPDYCIEPVASTAVAITGIEVLKSVESATVTESRETKTCSVFWEPPSGTNPIDVQVYHIRKKWRKLDEENYESDSWDNVTQKNLNHTFRTSPNRNYSITIQPINCAGKGPPIIARGTCTSSKDVPQTVPGPSVSREAATEGTRSIRINFADESNGLISCYFIIVAIGKVEEEKEFTLLDLQFAQYTSKKPSRSNGDRYIAIAISRPLNNESFVEYELGDGSKTKCNSQKILPSKSKREISSSDSTFEGRNWRLDDSNQYSVFTVVSVPTEHGILFSKSSIQSLISEDFNKDTGTLIIAIVVPLAALVLIGLTALLVCFVRKRERRQSQSCDNAGNRSSVSNQNIPKNEDQTYERPDNFRDKYENIAMQGGDQNPKTDDVGYEQPRNQMKQESGKDDSAYEQLQTGTKPDATPYAAANDGEYEEVQRNTINV